MATTTYRNFIGGEWVESGSKTERPNLNPANTDDVIGMAKLSTREEAEAAIQAAIRALPAWRKTPAPERARVIARACRLMTERKEALSRALTREEGKILREARGEVQKSINALEFFSGEGFRMSGQTVPSELKNTFAYTIRQGIGVIGVITPWNFPVAIPAWKIAPALVAGDTVVFKPATNTPDTARMLVEIFVEAGLPAGVLNMVIGSGGAVGDTIVRHPAVRAITFTGSTEVGKALYQLAAGELKKVQCEMGGKNPVVVLEDADIELAAEGTAQGAFGSTGQRCTATSRAIVLERVADRFVELVVEKAKKLRLGDGLRDDIDMGPSVDEAQLRTVLEYQEIGKSEAKLLCGGKRADQGELRKGYFPQPTVFDHVKPNHRIFQEEIFGPVLAVTRVKSFEEAMEAANGVAYGLTSSIYGNDQGRIFRFIEDIETGITHVNSPTMGGEPQLPFGGTKATGIGAREMGTGAIDFYTELKTVYIDYTGQKRATNIY